jgi:protein-tyrosine phosphatase
VSYQITAVCLGNICRSPIAEAVLRDRIQRAGLAREVTVDSAGTGDWHLGRPADPRTLATLAAHDYQLDHRARQIDPTWLAGIDLVLAMDMANYQDLLVMKQMASASTSIRMLRAFDPALAHAHEPSPELEVPDPYESGDARFVEVLHMIEAAADGLVATLSSQLGTSSTPRV